MAKNQEIKTKSVEQPAANKPPVYVEWLAFGALIIIIAYVAKSIIGLIFKKSKIEKMRDDVNSCTRDEIKIPEGGFNAFKENSPTLIPCLCCKNEISSSAKSCPSCGHENIKQETNQKVIIVERKNEKSRGVAIVLALFLGGIGAHRFYLNKPWQGVFSVLFVWTLIPMLISLVEVVLYLFTSDERFHEHCG